METFWILLKYFLAVHPLVILFDVIFTYFVSIFYGFFILKNPNTAKNSNAYSQLIDGDRGVSILKPLLDNDKYQKENLESHFQLNYGKLQIVLCIQDPKDPIIAVVNDLKLAYPKVDCEVVFDDGNDIVNPMVSNMANGYDRVKYDYVWISTSRIKATDEILYDLIAKAEDNEVAIVHQLPYTCAGETIANIVDKVSFGGYFARNYIALNVLGACCMTGMSYLIKKKILDDIGGLRFFGKYLAEDFFLASMIHKKGYRFRVSAFPAQQKAPSSLHGYLDRMTRWMRLRLNMLLLVVLFLEFTSECLPLALYLMWACNYIFNIPLLWTFLAYARVIRQAANERCFHIFYQLLVGSDDKLKKELVLENVSSYKLLSNGLITLTGYDEKEMYEETVRSLDIMGIGKEDQDSMFRVISSVLHMGNMEFKEERSADQATLPDNTDMKFSNVNSIG